MCHWLLSEGGASLTETSESGNIWDMLLFSFAEKINAVDLLPLLRFMTLLGESPISFKFGLPNALARLVEDGHQLRILLPLYLRQQTALLAHDCPLPAALLPLVANYAAPTHEDMWTDWVIWIHVSK
jgi:hypothetical protein